VTNDGKPAPVLGSENTAGTAENGDLKGPKGQGSKPPANNGPGAYESSPSPFPSTQPPDGKNLAAVSNNGKVATTTSSAFKSL